MKKILALSLAPLLLTGCSAPLELDSSTAEDVLFSKRDFSIDLVVADEELRISDVDSPIFAASEDCKPDADIAAFIEDEGRVLASSDLVSSEDSGIYINQDILEFETPEIAVEFFELIREGLQDSDCAYNSTTDLSTVKTNLEELGTSQEVFEVQSDDSLIWIKDAIFKAESLDLDLSSDSLIAAVLQNNYVLVLNGTVYRDTDAQGSIRDLEEDFAIIVKQFVTGKPVE